MKFTLATLFATLASTVLAQTTATTGATQNAGVAVNLPSLGQVLNAGTSFKITWTVDSASTNPSTTIDSIALMKGGSANLETTNVNILSAPIPVNPPSYDWNIPATIETNPSYVLALKGSNGAITYSTYFTIMGAAAGTTNSTAASSSVAANASATGTAPTATNGATKTNNTAANASSAGASSPSSTSAGSKTAQLTIVGAAGAAGILALML